METQYKFPHTRSDFIYAAGYRVVDILFNAYFKISHEGLENINGLDDKPLVVLPFPHTRYFDVPLESHLITKRLGRSAYFIMAESVEFQALLKKFGGLPITRTKDLRVKGINGHTEESDIKKLPTLYRQVIPSLLKENEVVVIHPQAAMNVKGFRQGVLNGLIQSQEVYGTQLTFLPLKIESAGRGYAFRSECRLRIGNQFKASTPEEIRFNLEKYI